MEKQGVVYVYWYGSPIRWDMENQPLQGGVPKTAKLVVLTRVPIMVDIGMVKWLVQQLITRGYRYV